MAAVVQDSNEIFPHPFIDILNRSEADTNTDVLCLTELRMCLVSAKIRDKPRWWEKYKDPEIVTKWKAEVLDQPIEVKGVSGTIPAKGIDWVIKELGEYDALRCESNGVEVSCFDGIFQSDSLIDEPLRELLKSSLVSLENIPESEKDWHPGSNKQVLNLIHPSLYPIVYGRTLGYPPDLPAEQRTSSKLQVIDNPWCDGSTLYAHYAISQKYSWLPTRFDVDGAGETKIEGYINNLHPDKHKDLYHTLELVFSRFVPMFERVLSELRHWTVRRIEQMGYELDPWEPDLETYNSDYDYEAFKETQVILGPDVPEYPKQGVHTQPPYIVNLKGRSLKVIVKVAQIILTPENPEYDGGKWHVEGMANECIVSTGIYYYEEENITESRLNFRRKIGEPYDYKQDDQKGTREVYGVNRNEMKLNQPLGSIRTCAGRCIAFPNINQHLVSPFKLQDPTKIGHRKILVFFLCDPNQSSIPDTTLVPPQQKDWYTNELNKLPEEHPIRNLPSELLAIVGEKVDGLMTKEEAEDVRLKLMEERSKFVVNHNQHYFELDFNMCEH